MPCCLQQPRQVKFGNDVIQVDAVTLTTDKEFCEDSLKAELACLYFLQLPMGKKRQGNVFFSCQQKDYRN